MLVFNKIIIHNKQMIGIENMKIYKLILLLLSMSFMSSCSFYVETTDSSSADIAISKSGYSENISDSSSIYVDSILVTLESSLTYVGEEVYETVFKDFLKENIKELTTVPQYYNNNFHRIFLIKLTGEECYQYQSLKEYLLSIDGVYGVDINANDDND